MTEPFRVVFEFGHYLVTNRSIRFEAGQRFCSVAVDLGETYLNSDKPMERLIEDSQESWRIAAIIAAALNEAKQ